MAVSEARICNMALLRIGVRQLINSLDENKTEAKVCKEIYAELRDQVLAAADWPFATFRQDLALVENGSSAGSTLTDDTGWGFKYALPNDCVKARSIWGGSRAPASKDRVKFAIEGSATVRYILTDMEDAKLVYTGRVERTILFPPHFVNALAWRLAEELALSIPVKPQLGVAAGEKYKAALNEALGVAFGEVEEDDEPESEFITERR